MPGAATRFVSMKDARSRRSVGEIVPPFSVSTLSHGTLRVPAEDLIHLQFRRFAGCPICNLHLRTFAEQMPQLERAGVRTVAVFD